jgi:uncharacterized protein
MSQALLTYEYVPDILERRAPHREGHLALLRELHAEGACLIAGATGDPVSGGAFGFASAAAAEDFVARDPYGAAGLIAAHTIVPWTVVVPAQV